MALRIDLDSYEAAVMAYLSGGFDSTGWPTLDSLERYLVADQLEAGSVEIDRMRAQALLRLLRSKLSKGEEVACTEARLLSLEREHRALLESVATADEQARSGLQQMADMKAMEMQIYETRVTAARARP